MRRTVVTLAGLAEREPGFQGVLDWFSPIASRWVPDDTLAAVAEVDRAIAEWQAAGRPKGFVPRVNHEND